MSEEDGQRREHAGGILGLLCAFFVLAGGAAYLAQLALRFCLSYAGVSTAIPGMLTVPHVEENILASRLGPLAQAERLTLERLYQEHDVFLGRQPTGAVQATSHVEIA